MRLSQRIFTDVPFIEHGAFLSMAATIISPDMAEHPAYKRFREAIKPKMEVDRDGIATIPIDGAIAYKPDVWDMLFYGVEDSRDILSNVESATRNHDVRGVFFDIHSPGGMMVGGFEIADAVRSLGKPSVAWAGGLMASLAYLIGSQADEVVASRSAQVGSIGTIISFADYSKFLESAGVKVEIFTNKEGTLKATGNGYVPLTDEQRDYLQTRVDKAYAEFKKQVLAMRPNIPADAMKGQTFFGSEAKKNGMVDRIGDKEYALGVLRSMLT